MIGETPLTAAPCNGYALVIGEDARMRQLLKLVLGGLALQVGEASSGHEQCLSPLAKVPRVVVVDVDPFFEHGMVVWHSLRRNPSTASIPSVFLIEAGAQAVRRLATMAGATVCLDKPFQPRHLRTTVGALLDQAAAPDTSVSSDTRPWRATAN